jgi:hypothetical protein
MAGKDSVRVHISPDLGTCEDAILTHDDRRTCVLGFVSRFNKTSSCLSTRRCAVNSATLFTTSSYNLKSGEDSGAATAFGALSAADSVAFPKGSVSSEYRSLAPVFICSASSVAEARWRSGF